MIKWLSCFRWQETYGNLSMLEPNGNCTLSTSNTRSRLGSPGPHGLGVSNPQKSDIPIMCFLASMSAFSVKDMTQRSAVLWATYVHMIPKLCVYIIIYIFIILHNIKKPENLPVSSEHELVHQPSPWAKTKKLPWMSCLADDTDCQVLYTNMSINMYENLWLHNSVV